MIKKWRVTLILLGVFLIALGFYVDAQSNFVDEEGVYTPLVNTTTCNATAVISATITASSAVYGSLVNVTNVTGYSVNAVGLVASPIGYFTNMIISSVFNTSGLGVSGNSYFYSDLTIQDGSGIIILKGSGGYGQLHLDNTGQAIIQTATADANVYMDSKAGGDFYLRDAGTTNMIIKGDGSGVGINIGANSPNSTLQVNGNITIYETNRFCLNGGCTRYIEDNTTHLVMVG